MEKRTARNIVLAVSAAVICLLLVNDVEAFAIFDGCAFRNRFLYHFFHVSAIHCLMNVWCLLAVAFTFNIAVSDIVVAFVCASFTPIMWDEPTVGLSGICFVLLGRFSYLVEHKVYYHSYMAAFILLGMLIPSVNGIIHLYCYIAGLLYGLLINPIKWKKKLNDC